MKSRRPIWLLAGLTILMLMLGAVRYWSFQGALPRGSVKIASASSWGAMQPPAGGGINDAIRYYWTSDRSVLHYDIAPDGSQRLVRDRLTSSQRLERDPTFHGTIPPGMWLLDILQDGAGLLWSRPNPQHPRDMDLYATNANGSGKPRLLNALWQPNRVWLPDGKRWLVDLDTVYLNNADGAPMQRIDKSALRWPMLLGANAQSHVIAVYSTDFFVRPDPAFRGLSPNYPAFTFVEFDPLAPSRELRRWKVRVPKDAESGKIALSPKADRILWLTYPKRSEFSRWLSGMVPGKKPTQSYGYELIVPTGAPREEVLQVSRLDGSDMHLLARLSENGYTQKNGYKIRYSPLNSIRWLPDGKHISFLYHQDLYIAPID